MCRRRVYLLSRKVVVSEAELKLAKCRHAESWPTFLCHMYCVVPSFYVGGRCPPRAGEKAYLLST